MRCAIGKRTTTGGRQSHDLDLCDSRRARRVVCGRLLARVARDRSVREVDVEGSPMKAGRELDALVDQGEFRITKGKRIDVLVAESVMGLKFCGPGNEEKQLHVEFVEDLDRAALVLHRCSRNEKGEAAWASFQPATSFRDAFEVVEKMRSRGWLKFELVQDPVEACWIAFFYNLSTYHRDFAVAVTPTEAICLAALKAVGVEVPA